MEASMTRWLLVTALMLMTLPSGAFAQSKAVSQVAVSKESLVGTWKLVSSTALTDNGEAAGKPAEDSTGLLTYTADGRMMAMITREGQKPISTYPPSEEERAAAFNGLSAAYAGSYTVTGDKVTHHIDVAWVRNVVNTDQVRTIRIEGDRLILRGGWVVEGRPPVANAELVWERLKPPSNGR
jgi:hypothetical protein